jgi:hypothetical protein
VEEFIVGVLPSFALPDGVDAQDDTSFAAERDHHSLIGVAEFTIGRVSAEEDHAGDFALTLFGDIKVGTDGEIGTAVVNHIFDREVFTLMGGNDTGIEGAAFRREIISRGNTGTDFGNKLFGKLDYKKLTAGVYLYSLIESLSFALCAVALIFNFSILTLILTIGFALFYFSDMVLMHNYFGEKKRLISILCHATYYPAQILIALSIFFIK